MGLNDTEIELFGNLYLEKSVPIREKYEAELKRIDSLDDINKHPFYFNVIKEFAREDINARVAAYIETYERVSKYPDEADFEGFADELKKMADRFTDLLARRYSGPFSPLPEGVTKDFVERLLEELSAHLGQIPGFAVVPLRRFMSEGKVAASLMKIPLKVFISYKWEDDTHNKWVEKVATDLRAAGIDAKLDKWEVRLGDSFTDYMTSKIAEADVVLFIMTSLSVAAAEAPMGKGGAVKFEIQMATSRKIAGEEMRMIGIYREGSQTVAHLRDHKYADFRDDAQYQTNLQELVDDLLEKEKRPPLGNVDNSNVSRSNAQLSLRDHILVKLYDLWSQNPKDFVGSERFRDMGDEDDIHEAILELAGDGLISHGEPIRAGVAQVIRRIPLIKITAKGKALAQVIKQSHS